MNTKILDLHQALRSNGAVFNTDSTEVLDFGQPQKELEQAAQGTIIVPLLHLSAFEVSGKDARDFLQNQFTNDTRHLAMGQVQHTAWCTAKGRMLANFLNYPVTDGYRLMVSGDIAQKIIKRLQMFILRSQVKLKECSETLVHFGVSGQDAATALQEAGLTPPEKDMETTGFTHGTLLRLPADRFIIAVDLEAAADLWQRLANLATPAGANTWYWQDIRDGFPWITAATQEEFVPQMADFEKLGGVSFHKGCYPGQEIVARTQYLGKVKRHLYRIKSPVNLAWGEDLFSPENEGQAAGKVISCTPAPDGGFVALAVVLAPGAANLHQGSPTGALLAATPVNP